MRVNGRSRLYISEAVASQEWVRIRIDDERNYEFWMELLVTTEELREFVRATQEVGKDDLMVLDTETR